MASLNCRLPSGVVASLSSSFSVSTGVTGAGAERCRAAMALAEHLSRSVPSSVTAAFTRVSITADTWFSKVSRLSMLVSNLTVLSCFTGLLHGSLFCPRGKLSTVLLLCHLLRRFHGREQMHFRKTSAPYRTRRVLTTNSLQTHSAGGPWAECGSLPTSFWPSDHFISGLICSFIS